MKNTLVALVLGALSLSTVMSSSAPAQAQHRDREPRGSYRRTCTDIRTERGTLYARCKDRRGNYRITRMIDYRRCPGDIENDNGRLRCSGRH
ncbi:CVNH domain-containing protein [Sorangium sp. So ce1335]|uniref:CVNH domain-containing protein n=1 Tax=Sorangium sp. So ce1335 TaxID=3133335 RepID=UPI003F615A95